MNISDMKGNPRNPRKVSVKKLDALKAALREFGDLGGFVYNKRSNQIISGHQRQKVLDKNAKIIIEKRYDVPTNVGTTAYGYVEIEGERFSYREVDWDESREKSANIAANKGAGEWDMKQLGDWFRELDSLKWNLDLTMFDKDEREEFFKEAAGASGNTDPDAVPDKAEARCKLGDLWLLGNHRLYCGDSTDASNVGRLMGQNKADMVWTDPPYNVDYVGKTKDALKISNDKMTDDAFLQFLTDAISNMFIATKPGGAFYIAHADIEGYNFRAAVKASGFDLKQCLIWVKSCFSLGRQDYQWMHEPILYGWRPGHAHTWCSDRKQTTILNFDKPMRNADHPTMKPVELIEYCIRNSTYHNAVVLDLFLGSGSTLIACEKSQRECYGMELSPNYCDVIIKRWEQFTGQSALLAANSVGAENG